MSETLKASELLLLQLLQEALCDSSEEESRDALRDSSKEELREALCDETVDDSHDEDAAPLSFANVSEECIEEMLSFADTHAVLSLLHPVLEKRDDFPGRLWNRVENAARQVVRTNYRLLFLTKYVTGLLEANDIQAIVLKGVSTAIYYPTPELRKAGDVDILLPQATDCARASELLLQNGFYMQEHQSSLHHIEMLNDEGICVELHTSLVEPFEERGINEYLDQLLPEYGKHCQQNTIWGISFYEPTDAYHAFYLLLHMLQHFLRAGFGLKFLCDWVVFWNREIAQTQKQEFLRLIRASGTEGFVRILTETCVSYLGLKRENVAFMLTDQVNEDEIKEFCQEIFVAGEFGHAKEDRMVAMRGSGLSFYLKEFHHQMHLNYPKAGRVFVLWPVLWICTLVRFLYNNHAVRGVTAGEIFKEASRRSKLIQDMKLFER